jgi:hypothetical protein
VSADYNLPTLAYRKTCNLLEGGLPANCDATVTNPFKGSAAFNGTSYYTSNTIAKYQLNRKFPQFSGVLTQLGRNDSWIKYNSFQLNWNWRVRGGVTLMVNYTLSKQIEEWGFNDRFTNTCQQGPYSLDRPQIIKFTAIYSLPFGEGKHFLSGANRVVSKLVSGWEATSFILDGATVRLRFAHPLAHRNRKFLHAGGKNVIQVARPCPAVHRKDQGIRSRRLRHRGSHGFMHLKLRSRAQGVQKAAERDELERKLIPKPRPPVRRDDHYQFRGPRLGFVAIHLGDCRIAQVMHHREELAVRRVRDAARHRTIPGAPRRAAQRPQQPAPGRDRRGQFVRAVPGFGAGVPFAPVHDLSGGAARLFHPPVSQRRRPFHAGRIFHIKDILH